MKQHRLLLRLVENDDPTLSAYHLANRVARLTELSYQCVSLAETQRKRREQNAAKGLDSQADSK